MIENPLLDIHVGFPHKMYFGSERWVASAFLLRMDITHTIGIISRKCTVKGFVVLGYS